MKQQVKLIISGLTIAVVLFGGFSVFNAKAAGLITVRDYLNRNQESLTSGVSHEIQFTPATNVSGGAGLNVVTLTFPDGDDGLWCRTAGALVTSVAGLKDSANALPGTVTAVCAQGSGATSYDTITISGVDDLTAGTLYAVKLTDTGVGKLGTPANTTTGVVVVKTNNGTADVDSSSIAIDILTTDEISVTGDIQPTLTFAISDNSIGFGSITAAALRYATGDLLGAAVEEANTLPTMLTVSTNATSGVVIEIKDTNPNNGTGLYSTAGTGTTIASMASTAVVAGTAGYGVYAKNATNGIVIHETFDNDSTADGAITTTLQTLASSNAPLNLATIDVSAVAAISGVTPAGSYADTLTVVATGKF